jgi:hypothetical protein
MSYVSKAEPMAKPAAVCTHQACRFRLRLGMREFWMQAVSDLFFSWIFRTTLLLRRPTPRPSLRMAGRRGKGGAHCGCMHTYAHQWLTCQTALHTPQMSFKNVGQCKSKRQLPSATLCAPTNHPSDAPWSRSRKPRNPVPPDGASLAQRSAPLSSVAAGWRKIFRAPLFRTPFRSARSLQTRLWRDAQTHIAPSRLSTLLGSVSIDPSRKRIWRQIGRLGIDGVAP